MNGKFWLTAHPRKQQQCQHLTRPRSSNKNPQMLGVFKYGKH
ncbi:hypothetical protein AO373_1584 [Moraxella catarrhalis]|nr:hypothetical protein AO380_1148 [Moraxella catarrhalis]OAV17774.1 hypothetical protein AO373_1584 [Moraxella catarrhalis]OAV30540.1 hypothetical protein AO367_1134 [Moraxella catarrhalis]